MTAAVAADAIAATVVDLTLAVLGAEDLDGLSAGPELKAGTPAIWVQLGLRVWKLSAGDALNALEAALALAIEEPRARAHLAPFFRVMTEAYLRAQDLAASHAVRGGALMGRSHFYSWALSRLYIGETLTSLGELYADYTDWCETRLRLGHRLSILGFRDALMDRQLASIRSAIGGIPVLVVHVSLRPQGRPGLLRSGLASVRRWLERRRARRHARAETRLAESLLRGAPIPAPLAAQSSAPDAPHAHP